MAGVVATAKKHKFTKGGSKGKPADAGLTGAKMSTSEPTSKQPKSMKRYAAKVVMRG